MIFTLLSLCFATNDSSSASGDTQPAIVAGCIVPLFTAQTIEDEYVVEMTPRTTGAMGPSGAFACKTAFLKRQFGMVHSRLEKDNNGPRCPHKMMLRDGSEVAVIIGFWGAGVEHFEPLCAWQQYCEVAEHMLKFYQQKGISGKCVISICSGAPTGRETATQLIRNGWSLDGQGDDKSTQDWIARGWKPADNSPSDLGPRRVEIEKAPEETDDAYAQRSARIHADLGKRIYLSYVLPKNAPETVPSGAVTFA